MPWLCRRARRRLRPQTPATDAGEASESLDHIVAIVNQDVILESDVQEEMRFSAFEPYRTPSGGDPRELAMDRLINRTLIIQQEKLEPQAPVTDAEVQAQIQELRRSIPACEEYKCETEEGWARYLADNDFTEQELEARWRERMEVLRVYRGALPLRHHASRTSRSWTTTSRRCCRSMRSRRPRRRRWTRISARIEEVLLQRQVTSLLNDWLKTLREQGSVRTLQPGEEAP